MLRWSDLLPCLAHETVTAVAVLTLVEEGRLRLADPVSRFLPEFKDLKVAVSPSRTAGANRPITIRVETLVMQAVVK